MRKIILITSLFFCLTITTILAQVVTTNIAAPDSNGFSNNQVSDFDVNSDGTILNNSATNGTATLRSTAVTGNSNITAGSEADLILLQVTGTSGSDLDGTIEVFGAEAGLIIANPNGIVCDGCAFINTNRVDLVTGSGYDADTNRFGTIAATEVTIEGDALDAVNVDFLHIQAGRDFINSTTINAESLSITAGVDFSNSGAIVADTLTIEVTSFADDVSNSGTVTADNLNFILTNNFSTSATSFNAFNSRNLAITTDGTFTNNATIDLDGNLTITANSFTNNQFIRADTVTIEVTNSLNDITNSAAIQSDSLNFIFTDDFTYTSTTFSGFNNFSNLAITTDGTFTNNATIDLDGNLTITAANNFTNNAFIKLAGNLTITANTFTNSAEINLAGNLTSTTNSFLNNAGIFADVSITIEVPNFVNDITNIASISSDSLNFILTDDFNLFNSSLNNFPGFSSLAITTKGRFANFQLMDLAGSFTARADSIGIANSITAATVTFEVPNFVNDITNSFTVSADSLNFIFTEDFTYTSDSFAGFNNFRNLAITTEGTFTNNDTIDLDGNLTITANSFDNSGGVVSADTFSLSVAGAFDYIADYGTITANAFNLQVGGDFSYNDSANDFVWGANDTLTVSGSANIVAADFTNNGTVNAATVTIEVPNFVNDIQNTGTISSASLNFILTDDFTHESNSFSGFNNFSNLAITTEGTFTNNNAIDLAGNLTITANTFINTVGVVADAFTLSVAGDFDYGTITANAFNLQVGGDFSYDDSANDFVLGASDTLTVSGSANIVAAGFANSGTITVTDSLNLTADTFTNSGGVLNADTFALNVAGDFDYGTITANTYNLQVGGNFNYDDSANDFIWGTNDTLTVSGDANIVAADFANSGNITVTNSGNFTANTFSNTGTVSAATVTIGVTNFVDDITNSGTVSSASLNFILTDDFTHTSTTFNAFNNFSNLAITTNGAFTNNNNIDLTGNLAITADGTFTNNNTIDLDGDFTITANTFNNTGGVVNADALTVSVAGDFDYGTITANSYNLNVDGDFSYDDSANDFVLGLNDILTVLGSANIVAADFENSGIITVTNNFNATVANFTNETGATITAGECNIVHDSFTDNGTISCLDSVDTTIDNIAVPNFRGVSINNYETFHIPLNGVVFNNSDSATTSQLLGDISKNPNYNDGDAASIILAQVSGTDISLLLGTFEVVGAEAVVIIANPNGISCNACNFINASRVDLVTGSSYNFNADRFNSIANSNIAIIDNGLNASDVDILNIHAGSFTNTGVLEANTFNLNVVGDFDNTQRGIINATSLNLEVGGDFSNNDASIGFVWEERDTLTVLGNANITALNFINHGSIDITNSFEITAGYTAINQGSIVSEYGSLDITANDFFRNLTGGDIAANTLNIIAGGKVTNTATIDVATLNITANNNSSRTDDRTGFYVSNRGNITATNLNIAAVDNFYNRGNITAANFTTSAKSVFLLNREIDSYDGTYDGGNISLNGDSSFRADGGSIENYGNIISLNGDSSFRADGGSIENYGNIDFGVFNLDLTANSFTNHEDANVTANTVNLDVASYINDGTVDAVVVNDGGGIIDTTSDQ